MRPSTAARIAAQLAVVTGIAVGLVAWRQQAAEVALGLAAWVKPMLVTLGGQAGDGIAKGFAKSPAVVAAIGVAFALPLIALVLMLSRALLRLSQRLGGGRADRQGNPGTRPVTSPLAKAWLQVEAGQIEGRMGRQELALSGEILRIGRAADNDLTLADQGIHDVHALIRRTPEAEFMIIDVSGRAGSGIAVNGHRLLQAPLRNGDRIELGRSALTFHRAMALPPARQGGAPTMTH